MTCSETQVELGTVYTASDSCTLGLCRPEPVYFSQVFNHIVCCTLSSLKQHKHRVLNGPFVSSSQRLITRDTAIISAILFGCTAAELYVSDPVRQ